jgi:tRNA1Val (adenine37-N6)-methyltransferase
MSNAYFAFRQFGIRQDRSAMKVSSDACIFGAWIPVPATDDARILDIGAGTGLLSLMLAQRHETARIYAVELDANAATQAAENVADSIFARRVEVIQADARHFEASARYQLIVSNPPFFKASLKGPDAARNAARHDESLDVNTLFALVARMLDEDGAFALLMPAAEAGEILQTAAARGFACVQRLVIREHETASSKRCCWMFRRGEIPAATEQILTIRENGSYSESFRKLLGSYYLLL